MHSMLLLLNVGTRCWYSLAATLCCWSQEERDGLIIRIHTFRFDRPPISGGTGIYWPIALTGLTNLFDWPYRLADPVYLHRSFPSLLSRPVKEGRKERPGDHFNGRFNRCPHDLTAIKVSLPVKVIFRRFVSKDIAFPFSIQSFNPLVKLRLPWPVPKRTLILAIGLGQLVKAVKVSKVVVSSFLPSHAL